MLLGPGPDLDRQIERKLNGDAKKRTPPYSTSEKAASRLLRRLEMQDLPASVEEIDGKWFCTFWVVVEAARERLATGSGETRALAIARAVMNARLGMGTSISSPNAAPPTRWTRTAAVSSLETRVCDGCGADLPVRNRETSNLYCTVCSWRMARDESASGKRVRIPVTGSKS